MPSQQVEIPRLRTGPNPMLFNMSARDGKTGMGGGGGGGGDSSSSSSTSEADDDETPAERKRRKKAEKKYFRKFEEKARKNDRRPRSRSKSPHLPRRREADTIPVSKWPTAAQFPQWKRQLRADLLAASGRDDMKVIQWIRRVFEADCTFAELQSSGDFFSLDVKLAAALLKIFEGREICC